MNNDALTELANKLGRSVEQLWPIAVRYVVTDSIVGILFCLLLLVVTLVVGVRLWKRVQNLPDDRDIERTLGRVFLVLAMTTSILVSTTSIFENVSHLINPEGYLVLEVLKRAGR